MMASSVAHNVSTTLAPLSANPSRNPLRLRAQPPMFASGYSYALMHGLAIERVFVKRGVSGARPLAERPEGVALLAALRPGDGIVPPKLDSMFRSTLDALDVLGQFRRQGATLHMIDLGSEVTANGSASWSSPSSPRWRRPSATAPASGSPPSSRTRGRAGASSAAASRSAGGSARTARWSPFLGSRRRSGACASCAPRARPCGRSRPRRGRPDTGSPTRRCAASWPAPPDRERAAGQYVRPS